MLKLIAELFPEDPTTAGMSSAWLPERGKFYVSICRYRAKFGEGKEVVAKAMDLDFEICCLKALNELRVYCAANGVIEIFDKLYKEKTRV